MYPPLQAAILPAWPGFLDSDGYPPDNGLVSWDVDAVRECPIIVRYRTFASPQISGKVEQFPPAARHPSIIPRSGMPPWIHMGGAQPEPRRVVLTMAEFRLRLGVRGGRTAYPPSGEPRGGLLRAAPLARHRVEAPAMPVVGVSVRNIRHPGVRASNESRLYCHRLAREGISVTIFPNRPQAGLISEPWGKPASGGTYTCWPRNVSGSAGAGPPMGRCRLIGTRGFFEPVVGLAMTSMMQSHRVNICSLSDEA